MSILIKFKKLLPNAKTPTAASLTAAGFDLYSTNMDPIMIPPHETFKMDTGLAFEIPKGYWGGIFARSGLATKKGLRPANCVGVIDSDYRGPIIVALHNDSEEIQTIQPEERIAQFILAPCFSCFFSEVKELDETERGEGGFGSTGMF